jgi:hypothetical protein
VVWNVHSFFVGHFGVVLEGVVELGELEWRELGMYWRIGCFCGLWHFWWVWNVTVGVNVLMSVKLRFGD